MKTANIDKLRYQTFPKALRCSSGAAKVVDCLKAKFADINSYTHPKQESDVVLGKVCGELQKCGFEVETSKKSADKISMHVLYGLNGHPLKTFQVDAYSEAEKTVVEVEAGQAVVNHRFLKDLFEACQMPEVEHLVVAVRNIYKSRDDFDTVCRFLETLYVNGRLVLPLKSVTIIGY